VAQALLCPLSLANCDPLPPSLDLLSSPHSDELPRLLDVLRLVLCKSLPSATNLFGSFFINGVFCLEACASESSLMRGSDED